MYIVEKSVRVAYVRCGDSEVSLINKCKTNPARKQGRNLFVCWLLNVPATCQCISGTDLHRQFYVLPH